MIQFLAKWFTNHRQRKAYKKGYIDGHGFIGDPSTFGWIKQ